MRSIFWDAMLFIYLLEADPSYKARAIELLETAAERGDKLFTSYLVVGEVMAGGILSNVEKPATLMSTIREMGFTLLPFAAPSVTTFARLRKQYRIKAADAINLSCAATQGIDLFLTGDLGLHKLHVPGIRFIADFKTPIA